MSLTATALALALTVTPTAQTTVTAIFIPRETVWAVPITMPRKVKWKQKSFYSFAGNGTPVMRQALDFLDELQDWQAHLAKFMLGVSGGDVFIVVFYPVEAKP